MAEMTEEERDLLVAQQKMEQVGAMMTRLVAPVVAAHYRELVKQGVPSQDAALLTTGVQELLLHRFWPEGGRP